MDAALHRFVRLLRLHGVRVSVAEAGDAFRAAAQPGVLADREILRAALALTLIKDRRDLETFEEVFAAFFGLRAVLAAAPPEHSHAHDDLSDGGELEKFTLGEEPGNTPQQGHSHGKPVDLHQFFNPEDLAQQYNLHQEANRLDMASMTDEIVLSNDSPTSSAQAARVQLTTSRLHNPGAPGQLTSKPGLRLDAELSVAQEMALLAWLGQDEEGAQGEDQTHPHLDDERLAALRAVLAPLLAQLPAKLAEHLETLLAQGVSVEDRELAPATVDAIAENRRAELEDSLRRLLHELRGAPRARRRASARGTVDGRRTMRSNMRYDGVPFRPITVSKVADRPRLVVLCDVSLSVRSTSLFTLQLVQSLSTLAPRVRSFAFVQDVVEITDLFAEHRLEAALTKVMAGPAAGGVIDVEADSDYGATFTHFLSEYSSALTRRTTVLVLGDGRGNGNDPGVSAFEEITRRARQTIWLTPEPRYSWALGQCDLPLYAPHCDRVQVVRGLRGLEQVSLSLSVAR